MISVDEALSIVLDHVEPLGAESVALDQAHRRILAEAIIADLDMAAAKLDVLDTLPVRVLGAVLNDVRPYGAYRYYTYDAAAYAEANGAAGRRRSGSAGVLWGRS